MEAVRSGLAALVVFSVALALATSPTAGDGNSETCHWSGGMCSGDACCVNGDTGSCYTSPEICDALCDEEPDSLGCTED